MANAGIEAPLVRVTLTAGSLHSWFTHIVHKPVSESKKGMSLTVNGAESSTHWLCSPTNQCMGDFTVKEGLDNHSVMGWCTLLMAERYKRDQKSRVFASIQSTSYNPSIDTRPHSAHSLSRQL